MSKAEQANGSLGAIILANGTADKLASHCGAAHKALLDIAGQPMVMRVLAAVQASPLVSQAVVACLQDGPVAKALRGLAPLAESAGGTFFDGIKVGFEALAGVDRVLLVTCDMPLLSPAAVTDFSQQVLQTPEADLVYAMVDIACVREAYPNTMRTAVRLREGHYTAAGISAVSARFVEHSGPLLMAAFAARKSKVAMGRLLGWSFLARFALGRLAVEDIVRRAEELLDCRARAVALPYPECGFDVDSVRDLHAVRKIIADFPEGVGTGAGI